MWYALMLIPPEHRMMILVASNDGDMKAAEAAMREAARALFARYLAKPQDSGSTP